MLRTDQLLGPAPHPASARGLRYRGPWRLPGPDSHRLAALSLSIGYVITTSTSVVMAPNLLNALLKVPLFADGRESRHQSPPELPQRRQAVDMLLASPHPGNRRSSLGESHRPVQVGSPRQWVA